MITLGIIYSDKDGLLESEPFSDKDSLTAYTLFSKQAAKRGMRAVLGGPGAYSDGAFSACWDLLTMKKVEDLSFELAWDRAIDSGKEFFMQYQKVLRDVAGRMPLANHPDLVAITEDKYETYKTFPHLVPQNFKGEELHKARKVFGGRVVTKPRYGSHGDDVSIQDIADVASLPEDFLIQPFIDSSRGIPSLFEGVHDLRVAVADGEIVDTYIRYPQKGLISNVSQGGKIQLVKKETLPSLVREAVQEVDARFSSYSPRFYSIDFMFDGERPWIIEMNKAPGIWGHIGAGVPLEDLDALCGETAEAFARAAKKL